MQAWVAFADPAQRNAVRIFTIVSMGGLAAVLAGALVGGSLQLWLWGLAIVLDVVAAEVGGQLDGWNLHPEHFSERHGLFTIIALGESLIVAAGGVTDSLDTIEILPIAILAVAITCALWWSYFAQIHPTLEHAVQSGQGADQVQLARDVFSLLHFPMVCGIVAYAVTIEEVVLHPQEPLSLAGRVALAVGVLLFAGGMAVAVYRATKKILVPRVLLVLITATAVVALKGIGAAFTLGIAFSGMIVILWIEQWTIRPIYEIHS